MSSDNEQLDKLVFCIFKILFKKFTPSHIYFLFNSNLFPVWLGLRQLVILSIHLPLPQAPGQMSNYTALSLIPDQKDIFIFVRRTA